MRGFLVAVAAAMLAGSGCALFEPAPPPVEKQFPGGEPGAERYLSQPPREDDPNGEASTDQPDERRIIFPLNRNEERGMFMSLVIDEPSAPAGEPLSVKCIVRNTTRNAMAVRWPTAQRFDVAVFADPDQRDLVYLWSEDRVFAQMFDEQTLSGGAALTRILDIPTTRRPEMRDFVGEDVSAPVGPGEYWVFAKHTGEPALFAGPVKITVMEPAD